MIKPSKPNKKLTICAHETFYFDYTSKKVSISTFLQWCKDTPPKGSYDICLELDERWEYDDCISNLNLSWKRDIPNPKYEKELVKYEKQLAKWKLQCQK